MVARDEEEAHPPLPLFLWSHRTRSLMNIQRSNPINISRYGRTRHKSHDFDELSCLRTTESHQSFSPNLGSPSPPETPDSSHCISRIGDYLLLEPLEGDHVFRAAHLHSGEQLVCKVSVCALYGVLCFLEKPPLHALHIMQKQYKKKGEIISLLLTHPETCLVPAPSAP